MFSCVNDAIFWLEHKKKKTKREDLKRITSLAKSLDIYSQPYKIIHIAGTNGKGSTAMYISNMLIDLGYKVGLYTSPYIIKFNERIMINNTFISDDDLLDLINYIYPIILKYEEDTSDLVPFFEILTLICLIYFKKEKVDYAVVECGLGGLLDATNFITPLASIITSIGYDHQNTLGNTIEEIARHKAGIIKANGLCFTISNKETDAYLKEVAQNKHAKLYILPDLSNLAKIDRDGTSFKIDDYLFRTPLYGLFQANNASLMIHLINYLFKDISNETIENSLLKAKIPGRFEVINNFILDGAHNISAIDSLVLSLKSFNLNNLTCIFASLKDKRYDLILKKLNEVVSCYVFPKFLDARETDRNNYLSYIDKPYIMLDTLEEAINYTKDKQTLVTGSLHFVSNIRQILEKQT